MSIALYNSLCEYSSALHVVRMFASWFLVPPFSPTPIPLPTSGVQREVEMWCHSPSSWPSASNGNSVSTCLGPDSTTTHSLFHTGPSRLPHASSVQACVAACGWTNMVLETHSGVERFNLSCRPSITIPDVPISPTPSTHAPCAASLLLSSRVVSTWLMHRDGSRRERGGLPG